MNEILGERIKALRSGTHLTQEQVADRIGINMPVLKMEQIILLLKFWLRLQKSLGFKWLI